MAIVCIFASSNATTYFIMRIAAVKMRFRPYLGLWRGNSTGFAAYNDCVFNIIRETEAVFVEARDTTGEQQRHHSMAALIARAERPSRKKFSFSFMSLPKNR